MSTVTPYNTSEGKKEQVAQMFDQIAPKYDFLNQVLSFGIHKRWRKKAVKKLIDLKPKRLLDVATGTGDFAVEAVRQLNPDKISGADISEGMMEFGRKKIAELNLQNKIEFVSGDAASLPFSDNTFDAITVGFGVRNFAVLQDGLKGMHRVLRPGGMLVVLEFSKPRKFPFKQSYNFYSRYILPLIGRMFSKDKRAYTYLPESVAAFPDGEDFLNEMKNAGFSSVSWQPLTFGVASIYTGVK